MSLLYKVVIGDSRRMFELPDNSVHLVVTSPPYWQLVVFSKPEEDRLVGDISRIADKREFFKEIGRVWAECKRVLVPGGFLVCEWEDMTVGSRVYGYPREICIAGDMIRSIEEVGLTLFSRWVWRKFESGVALSKFQYTMYSNLEETKPRAVSNWAYCFAFRKMGKRHWKLDFSRKEWTDWADGVWYIEAGSQEVEGIAGGAVFPTEIPRRFIRLYTQVGETVLDPFGGTGTTMKVAFELKRSCVIYEVLPKMKEIILKKVGYGQRPLDYEVKWELVER